jgi:hypothetical protein
MIIEKELVNPEFASFAYFVDNRIYITTKPLECKLESKYVSLKNVQYTIKDSVLYLRGTRLYFQYLPDVSDLIILYSSKICNDTEVYTISKDKLDLLENPPEIKEITMHRRLLKNKKIMGYELGENDKRWFKLKLEEPFEIAMSNFLLKEK